MKRIFILPLAFFCLAACTHKPTEKELAAAQLQKADSLFAQNDLEAAKLQIDSLKKLYPNLLDERKKAEILSTKIKLTEQQRNLSFAREQLPEALHCFDSISKNFVFEKDEAYQDAGNFVYKTQQYASGNCLKPYVEESGALMLTSLYRGGSDIKHNAIKLSAGNVSVESETVTEDGYNHRFRDNELFFERVTFRSNNAAIASFVQENSLKNILVTLQGDTRKTTFYLSSNEKKAIAEAQNLAIALTSLRHLQRIITTAEKKKILYEMELSK